MAFKEADLARMTPTGACAMGSFLNQTQQVVVLGGVLLFGFLGLFVPWREVPMSVSSVPAEWPLVRNIFIKAFPDIPEEKMRTDYERERELSIARTGHSAEKDRGYAMIWVPPEASAPNRRVEIDWQRMIPPIVILVVVAGALLILAPRTHPRHRVESEAPLRGDEFRP